MHRCTPYEKIQILLSQHQMHMLPEKIAAASRRATDLSYAPVGIVAGEVLMGAFLLLLAGFIHRRYRWRSERSWVLFDWDVVADKAPPKTFSFAGRFGIGHKHVSLASNRSWLYQASVVVACQHMKEIQMKCYRCYRGPSLSTAGYRRKGPSKRRRVQLPSCWKTCHPLPDHDSCKCFAVSKWHVWPKPIGVRRA